MHPAVAMAAILVAPIATGVRCARVFHLIETKEMTKFTYLVLTNAAPGREDEFDRWYSEQHVPDVLRVPGVVSAQRFRRVPKQSATGQQLWQYMALYECDASEPDVVTDGIRARINTVDMPMSDAMTDVRYACFFEPITKIMRKPGA